MSRGFTLVEVLATTALAALLMLVGLSVVGSVGRTRTEMVRRDAASADTSRLVELIRWDLSNARYVRAETNRLMLVGYCGLDAVQFSPRHRPVAVTYTLRTAGGRRWVIREQTNLDVLSNQNQWSELVCADVAELALLKAGHDQSAALALVDASGTGSSSGWGGPAVGLRRPRGYVAVPDRARLVVRRVPGAGVPPGVAADALLFLR